MANVEEFEGVPTPTMLLAELAKAHKMVSELCDGTRKWVMSIPARPEEDPDLVIGRALRWAQRFIKAVPQLPLIEDVLEDHGWALTPFDVPLMDDVDTHWMVQESRKANGKTSRVIMGMGSTPRRAIQDALRRDNQEAETIEQFYAEVHAQADGCISPAQPARVGGAEA